MMTPEARRAVPIAPKDLRSQAKGAAARLVASYPAALQGRQREDLPRISEHVAIASGLGTSVVDVGSGIGLFGPTCAALGMEVVVVDDFADPVYATHEPHSIMPLSDPAIRLVHSDIGGWSDAVEDEWADVVTCFESLEHLHGGAGAVLRLCHRKLRPGGHLLVSTPNAVNLVKRLRVLGGRSNLARLNDWYDAETFRGHVREPTLDELVTMVSRAGFEPIASWGRNWQLVGGGVKSALALPVDALLRRRPTFSQTIYVLARR